MHIAPDFPGGAVDGNRLTFVMHQMQDGTVSPVIGKVLKKQIKFMKAAGIQEVPERTFGQPARWHAQQVACIFVHNHANPPAVEYKYCIRQQIQGI